MQLIVNDGTVSSLADSVTISTLNVPPLANAGPNQAVTAPTPITLDGSGSSDDNGDLLTYSWSLTITPACSAAVLTNPTSVSPTFTANCAGSYTVELIVNDGTESSTPASVVITAN